LEIILKNSTNYKRVFTKEFSQNTVFSKALQGRRCAGKMAAYGTQGARIKIQKQLCSHASKAKIPLNKRGQLRGRMEDGPQEMLGDQESKVEMRPGQATWLNGS